MRTPMRPTRRPKLAKNGGKTPQLMPSLRLLTSPAWEAAKVGRREAVEFALPEVRRAIERGLITLTGVELYEPQPLWNVL